MLWSNKTLAHTNQFRSSNASKLKKTTSMGIMNMHHNVTWSGSRTTNKTIKTVRVTWRDDCCQLDVLTNSIYVHFRQHMNCREMFSVLIGWIEKMNQYVAYKLPRFVTTCVESVTPAVEHNMLLNSLSLLASDLLRILWTTIRQCAGGLRRRRCDVTLVTVLSFL